MIPFNKLILFSILTVSILLVSCSINTGIEEVVEVDKLTVTFEQEKCIYAGPKMIRSGEVTIILNNLTDTEVTANVSKLDSGKTWQDFVDALSGKNKGISYPEWVLHMSAKPVLDDPGAKILNLDPGLYAISCAEILEEEGSLAFWLASLLEVK